MKLLRTLWHYYRTRALTYAFSSREELEQYQARAITKHLAWLARNSAFFSVYEDKPLAKWPLLDKQYMLENFDQMNTAGLALSDVFEVANRSEQDRNFAPLLNGYTVGLSSGTSGQRGVFVASAAERARWAGIMLGKALPRGLFDGERVALFLRANSSLYTAVKSPWLTFRFFDLFTPFNQHLAPLEEYAPTVLVAPAQVLCALAQAKLAGNLAIWPLKVISAAEVLEPTDRKLIESAFGSMHELYQATEGFLASTCEYGNLHLNEEFVHVEPEWLDDAKIRFVPIVTDFSRTSQPIVRYRLNDVLVRNPSGCPCGRHTMTLSAIEGRCDDRLVLPGTAGTSLVLFADHVSRMLARSLPTGADYRLVQTSRTALELFANVDESTIISVRNKLVSLLQDAGVVVRYLDWSCHAGPISADLTAKRRRIINHYRPGNA